MTSAIDENAIEQRDPVKRRSQMQELVQAGLQKIKKEDKVKQVIGEVLQGVLSVKDMVDSALQPVPHAAIAWAGVCFALQVSFLPQILQQIYTDLSEDIHKPHNRDRGQSQRCRLCHVQNELVL